MEPQPLSLVFFQNHIDSETDSGSAIAGLGASPHAQAESIAALSPSAPGTNKRPVSSGKWRAWAGLLGDVAPGKSSEEIDGWALRLFPARGFLIGFSLSKLLPWRLQSKDEYLFSVRRC